ncbi:RodZ domain-containing protein [Psychromonas sp. MME2]|uniref:RodZ domain-containing protein n=1 Tax=unclassified Psychromonas TaxID=2614957 RepID=UPI00339D234F
MNNQEQAIIVPLGQALKDARIVASLSVDDVAEKLNLSASTVLNIENELDVTIDSDKYPSIYLRGYIVNYGKLVGLHDLSAFAEFKKLTEHHKYTFQAPQRKPPRKNKRRVTWLLLLATIVFITLYWFADQQGLFTDNTPIENKTENATMKIDSAPSDEDIQHSAAEETLIVENAEQTEETSAAQESQLNSDNIEEAVEPDESDSSTQSMDDELDIPAVSNGVEPESTLDKSVLENGVSESLSTINTTTLDDTMIGQERLTLTFSKDCWTEIFDANNKRLAFNLYKKGAQLNLIGVAPFKLKLGDPAAVEIQYQGEIVDGQFKSGRTTRFTIP